jgi:hypothetical protein
MLAPDSRAILQDLLKPPPGSALAHGVGTTFTVDLASALGVPLSFASRDLGSSPDAIGVMEAVRSTSDRVDVFYQAGHAAVPAHASDVLAFLEPVLHPVRAPRPGRLFHPKLWLLKFLEVEGSVAYRLLCLTRNLTSAHAWDAVVSLDGRQGSRIDAANQPLSDFVTALPGLCTTPLDETRRERVVGLAREVRRAVWERPDDVKAHAFHALGITPRAPVPDYSGYRRLVVSPFVDDRGLAVVSPGSRNGAILVARPEHLDRLEAVPEDTEVKVVSVLAELEDDRAAGELGGLHAKMVVVERNRLTHLFVGSANATHAAFDGNVEFVVELILGAAKNSVDAFLSMDSGLGVLLEDYEPQAAVEDPEQERRFILQDRLRQLAEMPWTLEVMKTASSHDLRLRTGPALPAWAAGLVIELLSRRGNAVRPAPGMPCDEVFSTVDLADITPFVVLTLRDGELTEASVVPASLVGDPEDRLDAVLARQVDTPEKFMRFLLLLLGLGGEPSAGSDGAGDGSATWAVTASQGLFELLARALADQPRTLDDLDRIVNRLLRTDAGRAVLPRGFEALWRNVQQAREQLGVST